MKRLTAVLLAIAMVFAFAACGKDGGGEAKSDIPGLEDGILTVAMECAYAPYNWAQTDDSNGAVPIKDSVLYANGYDVMTAKAICEKYGWKLEVIQAEWGSLVPGIQSGVYDAVIAGQSMTAERMEMVDFAGPYLYATIVCLTMFESKYADAKGVSDLAGGVCTSQIETIWYDLLDQIPDADIKEPTETAPAMLQAVVSGTVDFVCTDYPTAQAALIAYPELRVLDFNGTDDNFEISDEDVNIGVSVMKGNTALKDAIDAYLSTLTADDFNALMEQAIRIQPLSE